MKGRAILMLLFALIIAGGAVWLARGWLDSQVKTIIVKEDAKAPEATIVVAREIMRFGLHITPSTLKEIPWSAGSIPDGAFSKIEDIVNDKDERVVLQAIQRNEPVLKSKITTPGGRATLSAIIDESMRAVTIRVNDVFGVAGFVLPNDRVDILLTRKVDDSPLTNILIQNVRVLAIDQTASEEKNSPTVVKAVTLEVTPTQTQKLALSSSVGTLSLALRNRTNTNLADSRTMGLSDLEGGSGNNIQPTVKTATSKTTVTKTTPKKVVTIRKRRKNDLADIRIMRALEPEVVKVIEEPSKKAGSLAPASGAPKSILPKSITPIPGSSISQTSNLPKKRI